GGVSHPARPRAVGSPPSMPSAGSGIGRQYSCIRMGYPSGLPGPVPGARYLFAAYERNPRVSPNWGPSALFSLANQALLTKRGGLTSQSDGAKRAGQSDRRRGQRDRRRGDRIVPERRHLPSPPGPVGRAPAITLPALWDRARRRRERAGHLLGGPAGTVPPLQGADLGALPDRGAHHGRSLRRLP